MVFNKEISNGRGWRTTVVYLDYMQCRCPRFLSNRKVQLIAYENLKTAKWAAKRTMLLVQPLN